MRGYGGPGKPVGAALAVAAIVAAAQAKQERETMTIFDPEPDEMEPYDDAPEPDDAQFGETFGDGGVPCYACKEYVDKHSLSEDRDSRGHRRWVCPS